MVASWTVGQFTSAEQAAFPPSFHSQDVLPPDSTAQPRVIWMCARRAGEFRRSAAGPRTPWSASRTATCAALPAKRRRTAARLQENIIIICVMLGASINVWVIIISYRAAKENNVISKTNNNTNEGNNNYYYRRSQ